ncbi:hypothetical protein K0M31_017406 [Melipona bicolor]|uniref:Uncharacterized protein n=1 Tax=Melipona bicolor TaxID=60889 RepID=A0AA40G4V8_9HYME|nr:hypothetical protein K0M31_017406 [Melipona bicolor]
MSGELPRTGDGTGGVTTANLKFPVAVFEADRSMDNYRDYPTDKPAKSSRVYRPWCTNENLDRVQLSRVPGASFQPLSRDSSINFFAAAAQTSPSSLPHGTVPENSTSFQVRSSYGIAEKLIASAGRPGGEEKRKQKGQECRRFTERCDNRARRDIT